MTGWQRVPATATVSESNLNLKSKHTTYIAWGWVWKNLKFICYYVNHSVNSSLSIDCTTVRPNCIVPSTLRLFRLPWAFWTLFTSTLIARESLGWRQIWAWAPPLSNYHILGPGHGVTLAAGTVGELVSIWPFIVTCWWGPSCMARGIPYEFTAILSS